MQQVCRHNRDLNCLKLMPLGYDSYGSAFDLYTKIGDGLYSRGTLRIMYQSPKVDKSSRLNCIDWYVTEKRGHCDDGENTVGEKDDN